MNEPLLDRISQLERSVKRWRLVSLLLAFLLTCVLAVAATFTTIQPTEKHGNFWLMLPWVRARAAREAELRARQEAVRVRAMQAEADRRAAEFTKEGERRAADEAAKKRP